MLHMYMHNRPHHIHQGINRCLTLKPLLHVFYTRISRREPDEAERAVLDNVVVQFWVHYRGEHHVLLVDVARVHSCMSVIGLRVAQEEKVGGKGRRRGGEGAMTLKYA